MTSIDERPPAVGKPSSAGPPPWVKGVGVLLLPLAFAGFLIALNLQKEGVRVEAGVPAPDFDLEDLEGNRVRLRDLRGKVVLLNFWATWCSSCVEEFPAMNRMAQVLASDRFGILAVNIETDGKRKAGGFVSRWPLEFPVLLDPENRLTVAYGTTGVPESFLIDTNGIVVKKYVGPRAWDEPWFERDLKPLLEHLPPTQP